MPDLELAATNMAAGGDAVARDADGRVVFVSGALPGERVLARLVDEKRAYARAVTLDVLDPSPDRVAPPCPAVAAGCGGCGWQHIEVGAQRRLKAGIVADSLRRIGKLDPPPIGLGPELAAGAYRTTVRCVVVGGRAGFRQARSHEPLAVDGCPVAHPLVDELIRDGRFGEAHEVTMRVGARTGERLVVVSPDARGVQVPDDVLVVGGDELRGGRRAWIHEEIAGRRLRISSGSFFQVRPDGAEALVDLARPALTEGGGGEGTALVDLYAGVGLFAATLGPEARGPVLAVERHRAAVADLRHNLAGLRAKVLPVDVERWRPTTADVVIADPSRTGLGRRAVDVVAATRARRVVLVSCDPASLGRDAGLLAARGYRLLSVTLVDLFPHTPHVEVVSHFAIDHPV